MGLDDLNSLIGNWSEVIALLDDEASYAFQTGDVSKFDPLINCNVRDILAIMYLDNVPVKVRTAVMLFFESEWQRFSSSQIEELRLELKNIYIDLRYDDLNVQFLIIELLAKFYNDSEALRMLIHFARNTTGQRKALACGGAGMFVRITSDMSQKKEVIRLLESTKNDNSEDVRQEAKMYLHYLDPPKLANCKKKLANCKNKLLNRKKK